MALTVQTRPDSVNGVTKSNYMTSRNPILYKIRREDSALYSAGSSVVNNAGFAKVILDPVYGNVTAYYQAGNTVYVFESSGVYVGRHTITSSAFAGSTEITLATAYTTPGNFGGYINNLSKRTDWKVEVEVFKGADNLSMAGIKSRYAASPTDNIALVNVSSIIKNYVSADWTLPGAVNVAEANTSIQFYIKYQEYFDGALIGSPTDDVANKFNAIHGALQVYFMEKTNAHGGNMLSYFPNDNGRAWINRKWCNSVLNRVRLWRGWPFTLSFIWPSIFTSFVRLIKEYDYANSLQNSRYDSLTAYVNKVNRTLIDPLTPVIGATTKKLIVELYADSLKFSGGAGPVTFPLVIDNNLGVMKPIGSYLFSGAASATISSGFTGPITISLYVRNSGTTATQLVYTATSGTFASLPINPAVPFSASIAFDQLRLIITPNGGDNYNYTYNNLAVLNQVLESLTVYVDEPQDNPVHLFWKDSTGGDQFHQFKFNQEYSFNLGNGRKAKRMILFADDLQYVEWEAINELNNINDVSRDNITELSSAVIKTHTMVDQQVYIIDQSGNKTGVIVIPRQPRTESRRVNHYMEIEIELPEVL